MDWGIGALGLRFKRFRVLGWVGVFGLRFPRLGVYWDGLWCWGAKGLRGFGLGLQILLVEAAAAGVVVVVVVANFGLRDISVREVATVRRGWSTFPRYCVDGALLDCQKRGSRTENRNVECAGRKKIRIFYKVFNVTIFPSRSGFLAIYFGMCVFLGFWQIRA